MIVNFALNEPQNMVLEGKLQLSAAAWERRIILCNFRLMVQREETQDVIQADIFLILTTSISLFNQVNI